VNVVVKNVASKALFAFTITALAHTSFVAVSNRLNTDWSYWHTILLDGVQVWNPGGVYGDNWNSFQFNPFPFSNLVSTLITCTATLLITVSIGSRIAPLLQLSDLIGRARNPSKFILYFLPGYIFLSFLMRLGTLFVGSKTTSFTIILLTFFLLIQQIRKSYPFERNFKPHFFQITQRFLSTLFPTTLFLFFLIFSLQNGRNFMVNDSNILFISDAVSNFQIRMSSSIPLFGKQSDEYFYNLFPASIQSNVENVLLWYWITNAFGKLSAFFWIVALSNFLVQTMIGFRRNLHAYERGISFLVASFVFFGTMTLDPSQYSELWGGSNPLIRTGHIGRYFIFIIPLWVIRTLMLTNRREKAVSLCLGFILLSGTSITNLYFAIVIVVLAFLTFELKLSSLLHQNFGRSRLTKSLYLTFLSQTLPVFYLYHYGNKSMIPFLFFVSTSLLIMILISLRSFASVTAGGSTWKLDTQRFRHESTKENANSDLLLVFISTVLGLIVGAFLWGNSHGVKFFMNIYEFSQILSGDMAFSQFPIFSDFAVNLKLGNWSTCPPVTPACSTVSGFLSFFGFFIFINLVMAASSRFFNNGPTSLIHFLVLCIQFFWVLFVSFLWLYGSPLMIDYWILARLLEIPIYFSIIFLGIILSQLFNQKHYIASVTLATLLLTWILVYIENTFILAQFFSNISFLIDNWIS